MLNPGRSKFENYYQEIVQRKGLQNYRFEPYVFEPGKHPPNPSYEETTLFNLMSIGSIVAAFVFAPSPPYSRSSFSNSNFFKYSTANKCNDKLNLIKIFRNLYDLGLWGNYPVALRHVYYQRWIRLLDEFQDSTSS